MTAGLSLVAVLNSCSVMKEEVAEVNYFPSTCAVGEFLACSPLHTLFKEGPGECSKAMPNFYSLQEHYGNPLFCARQPKTPYCEFVERELELLKILYKPCIEEPEVTFYLWGIPKFL